MDPDMNKYDLEHVCTAHPRMSGEEWSQVYRDAWARYYTDAHVETVLRRAVASGLKTRKIADVMTAFSSAPRGSRAFTRCNAASSGARSGRAAGMACRSSIRWSFYPKRAVEFVSAVAQWLSVGLRYHRDQEARRRRSFEPKTYVDDATRVLSIEEMENDELVAAFADKIPDTYGAPKRHAVAVS